MHASRLMATTTVLVIGIGGAAAAAPHAPTLNQTNRGLHITGKGTPLPDGLIRGGIVQGRHQSLLGVAVSRVHGGPPRFKRLDFLTHRHGANKWVVHHGGHARAAANVVTALSPSGATFLTVVADCADSSLETSNTSVQASRLSVPVAAFAAADIACKGSDSRRRFISAVSMAYDKAAVLFEQIDAVQPATRHTPLVSIGTPGKAFPELRKLPNPGHLSILPESVAVDRTTGDLVVVGYEQGDRGGIFAWTKPANGPWSEPTEIAIDSDAHSFYVPTVTAAGGRIIVGVNSSDGPVIITRNKKAHWSDPKGIPYVLGSPQTGLSLITTNPKTGAVSVILHHTTGKTGLSEQVLTGHRWSKPDYLVTKAIYVDPLDLSFSKRGHPILTYYAE